MTTEIERKFIVNKIPEKYLDQTPLMYERYYVYADENVEFRVQKKGDKFELERKIKNSDLSRDTLKIQITKGEFSTLKANASQRIVRQSYLLETPGFSIKEYLENFSGLIRAEFEFETEKEAVEFVPPEWAGAEITNTPIGKDSQLIKLSEKEFQAELERCRYSK